LTLEPPCDLFDSLNMLRSEKRRGVEALRIGMLLKVLEDFGELALVLGEDLLGELRVVPASISPTRIARDVEASPLELD
jgi:hypothetical protein